MSEDNKAAGPAASDLPTSSETGNVLLKTDNVLLKTDNVFLFVPNLIGYSRVVLALLSFWYMPTNCFAAGFCYLVIFQLQKSEISTLFIQ
jgi:hypothetical protein